MTTFARAAMFGAIFDCAPTPGVSTTSGFLLMARVEKLNGYSSHAVSLMTARDHFAELMATWKRDTAFTSSFHDIVMNRSYQEIIGLGKAALPWIFSEMREEPNYWFWALSSLTGADPVAADATGNLHAMTEAWLNWGERRGYIA